MRTRRPLLAGGLDAERLGELPPRLDVELAVRVAQVVLDRLGRDEQGLGDLAVALTGGGQLGDPPLGGGERFGPAQQHIAAGASAAGGQLAPGPLMQRDRAAAAGHVRRLGQGTARFGAAILPAERGAKVEQRTDRLQAGWRVGAQPRRRPQAANAAGPLLAQADDATCADPQMQDVAALGSGELLLGQRERAITLAEEQRGLGGGRAPRAVPQEAHGSFSDLPHEQRRLERLARTGLGEPELGHRVDAQHILDVLRVIERPILGQHLLGLVELPALGQAQREMGGGRPGELLPAVAPGVAGQLEVDDRVVHPALPQARQPADVARGGEPERPGAPARVLERLVGDLDRVLSSPFSRNAAATIRQPIHGASAWTRIRPPSQARSASSRALWADSPVLVVACRAAWARSSRWPCVRGPLTACSITWAERASACGWRSGTIEAAEKKLASSWSRSSRPARVVGLVGQLGHARVVRPRCLFVQSLGVEGPAELQRQLGAPAWIRRRLGGVREVLGGLGPAERGLGRSQFGEHVGAQLGGRRLLERARQVADRRLGGTRLARGGAQPLDHPRIAAGVRQQQVRGDALGLDPVGVEQPGRVEMAARALEQRDVLLDRVLDERVHEAKWRAREQHLDPGQGIRGAAGRLQREAGKRSGAAQGSVGAEDGDGAGERRRVGAEPADADPQRSDHGVGGEGASAAASSAPVTLGSSASAASSSCR